MGADNWLPKFANITYTNCAPFRPFRHTPDKRLADALDAFKPDVLFMPVERYIGYKSLPVVVMLQNMAPLTGTKTGAGFKELLVGVLRRYETKFALERSVSVIVPTEFVRNFLVSNSGIPAKKITAINYGHNAPSVAARPPTSFPFSERFIFTAGSLEAYRGLEDLIQAMPALKVTCPGIKLAIAGGARPSTIGYLGGLKSMADRLKVSSEICWMGNLPEEELAWCYANCSVFAVTSRVESFCFVALEALTHGCNIISTDSACLPEILGEEVVYYKAGDVSALSRALVKVLDRDAETRKAFSEKAGMRGSSFLWEDAVRKTLDVLKQAVGAPKL
jgi:glycogen(starch) synthase